jgi:hypothetical protein
MRIGSVPAPRLQIYWRALSTWVPALRLDKSIYTARQARHNMPAAMRALVVQRNDETTDETTDETDARLRLNRYIVLGSSMDSMQGGRELPKLHRIPGNVEGGLFLGGALGWEARARGVGCGVLFLDRNVRLTCSMEQDVREFR